MIVQKETLSLPSGSTPSSETNRELKHCVRIDLDMGYAMRTKQKHLAQTVAEEVMIIASDRLFEFNEMAYVKLTGI